MCTTEEGVGKGSSASAVTYSQETKRDSSDELEKGNASRASHGESMWFPNVRRKGFISSASSRQMWRDREIQEPR